MTIKRAIERVCTLGAIALFLFGCAPSQLAMSQQSRAWDECNGASCFVSITPDPSGAYSCAENASLKFRIANANLLLNGPPVVVLHWTLTGAYGFCGSDDAFFKAGSEAGAKFTQETWRSDRDDGTRQAGPGSACSPKRNRTWTNDHSNQEFEYGIRFHAVSGGNPGAACTIDPFIKNG